MAIDASEDRADYGYAVRRNNTCADGEQTCYTTWGGFRTCCPDSTTCPDQVGTGVCCPNSDECTEWLAGAEPHCADKTANLFNAGISGNQGRFCCSNDTEGFFVSGKNKGVSCAEDLEAAGENAVTAIRVAVASTASDYTTDYTTDYTADYTATSSTSSATSSTMTSTMTSTTPPAPASTTSSTSSDDSHSSNTGAIAGGVVGGVVGAAILLILAWWLLRRRRGQEGYRSPGQPANGLDDHFQTVMGELPESKSQTAAELPESKNQTAGELPGCNPQRQTEPSELWSGPVDR